MRGTNTSTCLSLGCLLRRYPIVTFVLFAILANPIGAIFSQEVAQSKRDATADTKQKPTSEKAINLTKTGKIRSVIKGSVYECPIELGALEAGKVYLLNLEISNPTDAAFEYDDVALQCSCSDLIPAKGTIPANGSASLMVRVAAVANPSSPKYAFSIRLSGGEKVRKNLLLVFDYEVRNFLKIAPSIQNIELTSEESLKEVKIPISFTSPVLVENLKVKAGDELKDVGFTPRSDGVNSFIEVLVHEDALINGSLWGEYQLIDKVTGAKTQGVVSAKFVEDFSISPAVVRFRPLETKKKYDENSRFVANLILRRNKKIEADTNDSAKKESGYSGAKIQISAKIKEIERALKVSHSPLGKFGYRVKLITEIPNELLEKLDGKSEIQWVLSSSELNSKLSSSAIFLLEQK